MRSRIFATVGAGAVLATSLGLAPTALAEAWHARNFQVPIVVCEPTSSSYAISTTNTNTAAPVQTITETITSALGLRLENGQHTISNVGSSSSVSACEQAAEAEAQTQP
ncbi:MAG TPA: hypothetical protein VKY90_02335 [Candidatus Dormibacteraeota bacterium]|nr:hypothetical protein [Candidatus Dormibacteraeota bacterium]